MRLIVTGSSGFIGSALCPMAESAGHALLRYKRGTPWPKWGEFDAVIHLAAAGVKRARREWADCMTGNFLLVKELLRAIGQSGATPRIVLAQSCREREMQKDLLKWDDPYVVSKRLGSLFAKDWSTHYKGQVIACNIGPCYAPGEVEKVAQQLLDAATK